MDYAPPTVIHNTDIELRSWQTGCSRALIIGEGPCWIGFHACANIVKEPEVGIGRVHHPVPPAATKS